MKKAEFSILELTIIIIITLVIGFSLGGIVQKPIEIMQEPIKIIKEIEKCRCSNLTRKDVEMIIRQEFVDALEFNYAIDGAMGEPRLVPLLKSIINK